MSSLSQKTVPLFVEAKSTAGQGHLDITSAMARMTVFRKRQSKPIPDAYRLPGITPLKSACDMKPRHLGKRAELARTEKIPGQIGERRRRSELATLNDGPADRSPRSSLNTLNFKRKTHAHPQRPGPHPHACLTLCACFNGVHASGHRGDERVLQTLHEVRNDRRRFDRVPPRYNADDPNIHRQIQNGNQNDRPED